MAEEALQFDWLRTSGRSKWLLRTASFAQSNETTSFVRIQIVKRKH